MDFCNKKDYPTVESVNQPAVAVANHCKIGPKLAHRVQNGEIKV